MDDKDNNPEDLNIPLILTNEFDTPSNTKIEILKIKDLIKLKYLNNSESLSLNDINLSDKNFDMIKKTAQKIEYDISENTSLINKSITAQETELKKLYNEKELLNQNKIQSDIIKNQQKLIDNYKKNNIELKVNLNQVEKSLDKKVISNKEFLINNVELKKTISRYIVHNKKLQENLIQLKKDYSEISFNKSQINEMIVKINFYQEENIRLSSEIAKIKKDYELSKGNFINAENKRNNIYKKIKELNNSLVENKTIPTPFEKNNNNSVSKNAERLMDIRNIKLPKKNNSSEPKNDLDDEINDIFN